MKSCVYAAVMVLSSLFSVHCQSPGEGVIIIGPETQVVAPGDVAYFHCHARGDSVYWLVNNRDPSPQSDYEARGFNFTYDEIPRPSSELEEHNNTIAIEARLSNNNTRISCTASGWIYNQHDFRDGRLIIASSPVRPQVNLTYEHIQGDIFAYHISWSTPFTWPGFPIISYEIVVYNLSDPSNNVLTEKFTNETQSTSLMHYGISSGETCYGLNFSVAATNGVGKGEATVFESGHPIVPDEIGDIEMVVSFLKDGTPHFWMSFFAPTICPGYQKGTHNVTIYDGNGSLVHQFNSIEYTQEENGEKSHIVKEMTSGLVYSKNYTVEVMTSSLGVMRSKRDSFYTSIDTHVVCPAQQNTLSGGSLFATQSCLTSADNLALIVGLSVGLTVILIFCCFMILVCSVVMCRTRMKSRHKMSNMPRVVETDNALAPKQKKNKPPNLTLQARNPIYEGAMYELTPGENLKSLMSPCSVPCTPLAESASRYTFDFPPRLPPPRKGSISIPPKLETHKEVDANKDSLINNNKEEVTIPQQQTGDEYMEMNGGAPKQEECTYASVKKWGHEDEYVSVK